MDKTPEIEHVKPTTVEPGDRIYILGYFEQTFTIISRDRYPNGRASKFFKIFKQYQTTHLTLEGTKKSGRKYTKKISVRNHERLIRVVEKRKESSN